MQKQVLEGRSGAMRHVRVGSCANCNGIITHDGVFGRYDFTQIGPVLRIFDVDVGACISGFVLVDGRGICLHEW